MKKILLIMAVIAALTSCDSNTFHIDGTIEGASDTTVLVLERSRNGEWIIEDSIKVDKNGKFSASAPAPAVPNIYQLRCGDQAICFPIDSLDHLTITAKMPNFAIDYNITGSEHAEQIMKIQEAKTALQIVQMLSEDVEITDEHVANLESLLEGIADGTIILDGGYKVLTRDEVVQILRASL